MYPGNGGIIVDERLVARLVLVLKNPGDKHRFVNHVVSDSKSRASVFGTHALVPPDIGQARLSYQLLSNCTMGARGVRSEES